MTRRHENVRSEIFQVFLWQICRDYQQSGWFFLCLRHAASDQRNLLYTPTGRWEKRPSLVTKSLKCECFAGTSHSLTLRTLTTRVSTRFRDGSFGPWSHYVGQEEYNPSKQSQFAVQRKNAISCWARATYGAYWRSGERVARPRTCLPCKRSLFREKWTSGSRNPAHQGHVAMILAPRSTGSIDFLQIHVRVVCQAACRYHQYKKVLKSEVAFSLYVNPP